jgi:hypothetical protein
MRCEGASTHAQLSPAQEGFVCMRTCAPVHIQQACSFPPVSNFLCLLLEHNP